jgi:hypothetical protein
LAAAPWLWSKQLIAEALMMPLMMVMGHRLLEHVIEGLFLYRPDEVLDAGVRLGTLGRRFEDPESKVVYVLVELRGETAVAVMQ